jgi:hypothetical protein
MFKAIIISFASKGREDYLKMAEKLYLSVKQHWKYDYRFYVMNSNRNEFEGMQLINISEFPNNSKFKVESHNKIPYQFKLGLIQTAIDDGYTHIFWLDSSISLNKCPLNLLNQSNKGIMAFHNLGHELKSYISDNCVEIINSNINEINSSPKTWGGCFGFDFTKNIPKQIFNELIDASLKGAFNESGSNRLEFKAHRHDQSVMSVLFYRYGIVLYNYGHILCYNPHCFEPYEYGQYNTFIYGKN